MNNGSGTSIQELWQSQPVEGARMSIAEIRKRAGKFEKKVFWRNLREYVAGGIAMVMLGNFFWQANTHLARTSFALLMAGLLYMLFHLHRNGSSSPASRYTGTDCVQFYLDELERQRKLVGNLWWYLGPLVPGLVLSMISSALDHPQPKALVTLAVVNAIIAGSFYLLIKLNSQAARCLQKQIDELRGLREAR